MSKSSIPAPNPVFAKLLVWGIALLLVAFVVLLLLKICGLAWSWWLITAPIWGPLATLVFFLMLGIGWGFLFTFIRRA